MKCTERVCKLYAKNTKFSYFLRDNSSDTTDQFQSDMSLEMNGANMKRRRILRRGGSEYCSIYRQLMCRLKTNTRASPRHEASTTCRAQLKMYTFTALSGRICDRPNPYLTVYLCIFTYVTSLLSPCGDQHTRYNNYISIFHLNEQHMIYNFASDMVHLVYFLVIISLHFYV
jgi:hypothetical protein